VWSRFEQSDRGDGEMVEATTRGWYLDLPGNRTESPTVEEGDGAMGRAGEQCLESDVPLGVFVSGGIDEALASVHGMKAVRRRGGRARTLCVRMPDPRYDESAAAARVAGIIGSEHETLECDARPAEQLVGLIRQIGLPFGDSSLLPTYWVSVAARRAVKAAVT